MFGPRNDPRAFRPFGEAVVDGFDFDYEDTRNEERLLEFSKELVDLARRHSRLGHSTNGRFSRRDDKKFYITASPLCQSPHANRLINEVHPDAAFVQFYNDPNCERDYPEWNEWAERKGIAFLIGLPAGPSAANTGYIKPETLDVNVKEFPRLTGVSLWDGSQAFNKDKDFLSKIIRFLEEVKL